MKQKKIFEGQRDQLSAQSFNMEQSNFAIQSMKDNQVNLDYLNLNEANKS